MAATNTTLLELENACQELQAISYTRPAETLPEIFGIANKEVYITQWLARILDPKNGFGYEPLKRLLRCAGYPDDEIAIIDEAPDLKIYTEYVFRNDERRIDILIESEKYIIGIENKINAWEHKDQTSAYVDDISDMLGSRKAYFIYLKPEYNQSVPSSDDFMKVTYTEYKIALEADKLEVIDPGENDRNIWLMKEFIKYMEVKLMKQFPEMNKAIKIFADHRDKIITAESEYMNYNESVKSWLENKLKENKFNLSKEWPQCWLIVKDEKWRELDFHFEILWDDEIAFAEKLILEAHLEGSKKDHQLTQLFKIGKPSKGTKKCLKTEVIACNFSSEEEANKTLNSIIKIFNGKEFQDLANIANEYLQNKS